MSKQLPTGKSNKDKVVTGRKYLPDDQRKQTIGVGLRQSEIERLDKERQLQGASNGVIIEQSVFARSCIMAYLALLDAIKDGSIAPGVLQKIRERLAREAMATQ